MSFRLDWIDKWTVDNYRDKTDTDEQWKLKKRFMLAHCESYPVERLLYWTQIFSNIIYHECSYPAPIMTEVEKLSRNVFTNEDALLQNRLFRILVDVLRSSETKTHTETSKDTFTHDNEESHPIRNSSEDKLLVKESNSSTSYQENKTGNWDGLNISRNKGFFIEKKRVPKISPAVEENSQNSVLDSAQLKVYGEEGYLHDDDDDDDDYLAPNLENSSPPTHNSPHDNSRIHHGYKDVKEGSPVSECDRKFYEGSVRQHSDFIPTENRSLRNKSPIPDNDGRRFSRIFDGRQSLSPVSDESMSSRMHVGIESSSNVSNPDNFDCETITGRNQRLKVKHQLETLKEVEKNTSNIYNEDDENLVCKLIEQEFSAIQEELNKLREDKSPERKLVSYPILSKLSLDILSIVDSDENKSYNKNNDDISLGIDDEEDVLHETNYDKKKFNESYDKQDKSVSKELIKNSWWGKDKSSEQNHDRKNYSKKSDGDRNRRRKIDDSTSRYDKRDSRKSKYLDYEYDKVKRRKRDNSDPKSPVSRHDKNYSSKSRYSDDIDERKHRANRDSSTHKSTVPRLYENHSSRLKNRDYIDDEKKSKMKRDNSTHKSPASRHDRKHSSGSSGEKCRKKIKDYKDDHSKKEKSPASKYDRGSKSNQEVSKHTKKYTDSDCDSRIPPKKLFDSDSKTVRCILKDIHRGSEKQKKLAKEIEPSRQISPERSYTEVETSNQSSVLESEWFTTVNVEPPMGIPELQSNFHEPGQSFYEPHQSFHSGFIEPQPHFHQPEYPPYAHSMPPNFHHLGPNSYHYQPNFHQSYHYGQHRGGLMRPAYPRPSFTHVTYHNRTLIQQRSVSLIEVKSSNASGDQNNPSKYSSSNLTPLQKAKTPSQPVSSVPTQVQKPEDRGRVVPSEPQNVSSSSKPASTAGSNTFEKKNTNDDKLTAISTLVQKKDVRNEVASNNIEVEISNPNVGSEKNVSHTQQSLSIEDSASSGTSIEENTNLVQILSLTGDQPSQDKLDSVNKALSTFSSGSDSISNLVKMLVNNQVSQVPAALKWLAQIQMINQCQQMALLQTIISCGKTFEQGTTPALPGPSGSNTNDQQKTVAPNVQNKSKKQTNFQKAPLSSNNQVTWNPKVSFRNSTTSSKPTVSVPPNNNKRKLADALGKAPECIISLDEDDDEAPCEKLLKIDANQKMTDVEKSAQCTAAAVKVPESIINVDDVDTNTNSENLTKNYSNQKQLGKTVDNNNKKGSESMISYEDIVSDEDYDASSKKGQKTVTNQESVKVPESTITVKDEKVVEATNDKKQSVVRKTTDCNNKLVKVPECITITVKDEKVVKTENNKNQSVVRKTTDCNNKLVKVPECTTIIVKDEKVVKTENNKKQSVVGKSTDCSNAVVKVPECTTIAVKDEKLVKKDNDKKMLEAGKTKECKVVLVKIPEDVVMLDDDSDDKNSEKSNTNSEKVTKNTTNQNPIKEIDWKTVLPKESVRFYEQAKTARIIPYLKTVEETTIGDIRKRFGPLNTIAIIGLAGECETKTLKRLNLFLNNIKLEVTPSLMAGGGQWQCRVEAIYLKRNRTQKICEARALTKAGAIKAVSCRVLWYLQHIYFTFHIKNHGPPEPSDIKHRDFTLLRFCQFGLKHSMPANFLDDENICTKIPFTTADDEQYYATELQKYYEKSCSTESDSCRFILFSPEISEETTEALIIKAKNLDLQLRWKNGRNSGLVVYRLTNKMYWDFCKALLNKEIKYKYLICQLLRPHETSVAYEQSYATFVR